MTRLSIEDDGMWQKSLASRVKNRVELKLTMSNGREYVGFVTGLDDDWLQICTTTQMKCTWLNQLSISEVEETGNKLAKMSISNDRRARIESYMTQITLAAESVLSEKGVRGVNSRS